MRDENYSSGLIVLHSNLLFCF